MKLIRQQKYTTNSLLWINFSNKWTDKNDVLRITIRSQWEYIVFLFHAHARFLLTSLGCYFIVFVFWTEILFIRNLLYFVMYIWYIDKQSLPMETFSVCIIRTNRPAKYAKIIWLGQPTKRRVESANWTTNKCQIDSFSSFNSFSSVCGICGFQYIL